VSVPEALSIRLRTGTAASPIRDVNITSEVDDLVFGATSPGGYSDCTLSLHRPLSFTPAEVAQFGRLYVYDARTAKVVWEGRLQDPGRAAGDEGEVYQLVAKGGVAHLQDDTRQLYYVDCDTSRWEKIDTGTAAASVETLADTGASLSIETPALILRIPQGTAVNPTDPSRVVATHVGFYQAGQKIAGVQFDWDCGLTAATLTASLYAATQGVGAADIAWTALFSTGGGSEYKVVDTGAGSSAWTNGRNKPMLRFHYTGAVGNVSADTWWLQITNLMVRTMLINKSGVEITTGYGVPSVLASEVVEDLLGRILGETIDGANATVTTTGYAIEQLAYPDGVTPQKVLDDLIGFEQAYTYHLWESNPANDLFRFEWVPWPTAVRYEADIVDGFDAPASGNTVFDQVQVRWHNRGIIHVSLRTQSVPMLTAAGFSRTAYIDLGDEASTQANAHRAGDQFLTEHQYPVNAGRLVVKRPILDIETGRMVMPWEIRPGELIRMRGVAPYPDALNATVRNGLTVFKVAATTYSSADAAATLDLDVYAPSVARALATLVRKPPARRR
jgi:hypothetical protein